ncbi:shufflon system plasmid conjugative transfer pilus tip adhesin PilV [Rhodomicrobium sp. Az07]|uniref:tail fiber domain-containing protein n=1 Tax=Rhodomicrobium sp. Az07 TaxID=2839034 RepID=UPI001BEB9BB4|nr:shufflon system plasmid conjugative transfer pilus tip adhesin PilV [Rhodomicrobium sp. Az07]MBT3071405.1 shufflon system plasmid conjugative transfer pilus tip adhesin PilV [Rhodomicrobium sp. Az07]
MAIGWNGNGGGRGETDFVNFPGLGMGGFNFIFANVSGSVASVPMTILGPTGNVGIGITSPSYSLDVAGDIHATGWLRTDGSQGWYSQTYGGGWYMADNVWIRAAGNKNIYTAGTILADTQLRTSYLCDRDGANCRTPAQLASAGAAAGSNGYVQYNEANALAADANFYWDKTYQSLIVGHEGGSIEIGKDSTSNNFAYLDLTGDATYADYGLRLLRGNTGPNTYSALVHRGTGTLYITAEEAGTVSIRTNNADRLFVNAVGNVGIGTTTPSQKLAINGNVLIEGYNSLYVGNNIEMQGNQFNIQDGCTYCEFAFNYSGYANANLHVFNGSGTTTSVIYGAGGMWTSGDIYANNHFQHSDRRLKDNIAPAAGLDVVSRLQGVTFNWKKDGTPSAGVIAQDVEKVMPEAVNTDGQGMKSVSYDSLMAPVIQAIRELKSLFEANHEAIAELKAANDSLRREFNAYKAAHP